MKASLELKIGQRLSMTPQLQQAIRLLQMSSLDLVTEIQQAVETNPMLEEVDAGHDQSDFEPSGVDREDTAASGTSGELANSRTDDRINSDTLNSDGPLDYEAQYDPPMAPTVRNHDGDMMDMDARREAPATLYDHLSEQVSALHLTDLDRYIAEVILVSMDNGGYIGISIEDIAELVNADLNIDRDSDEHSDTVVTIEDVGVVLKHMQNLEPTGVGARSLTECLLIQLRAFENNESTIHARDIVSRHLESLAARDFETVRKALGIENEQLKTALDLVHSLDARPGNQIASETADYVVPDIIVQRGKIRWTAALNTHNMPSVRVNETYAGLIKRGNAKEDNAFMKEHLNDARFFIKSLHNRHDTLLRVAREIVDRQQEFFNDGDEAMRPMVLADIATTLDLHESTISRATTQKYMLTPKGVFELKYFFSSGITNATGDAHSATAIRSMIKKLIETEPPSKPVSDSKIASSLANQGVKVARRTVAKYREAMNIPASNLRKEIS